MEIAIASLVMGLFLMDKVAVMWVLAITVCFYNNPATVIRVSASNLVTLMYPVITILLTVLMLMFLVLIMSIV